MARETAWHEIQLHISKKQVGIPDAVNIAKKFINKKPFVLALADNLFVGKSFTSTLKKVQSLKDGAAVLAVKQNIHTNQQLLNTIEKKI